MPNVPHLYLQQHIMEHKYKCHRFRLSNIPWHTHRGYFLCDRTLLQLPWQRLTPQWPL